MSKIYVAEYETRSFSFRAVGRTRDEALEGIRRAWKNHCAQYDADWDYYNDDDVNVDLMVPGAGYRDHALVAYARQPEVKP